MHTKCSKPSVHTTKITLFSTFSFYFLSLHTLPNWLKLLQNKTQNRDGIMEYVSHWISSLTLVQHGLRHIKPSSRRMSPLSFILCTYVMPNFVLKSMSELLGISLISKELLSLQLRIIQINLSYVNQL